MVEMIIQFSIPWSKFINLNIHVITIFNGLCFNNLAAYHWVNYIDRYSYSVYPFLVSGGAPGQIAWLLSASNEGLLLFLTEMSSTIIATP